MIKNLILLLLFGFLWIQDTLITKKGVIYSGKIISSTEKFIDIPITGGGYGYFVKVQQVQPLKKVYIDEKI